ncbi:MAG: DUF4826 family protein [Burkholderiales bacterium]
MASTESNSEDTWCAERVAEVAACLQRSGLEPGRIGEWPAWHVMPYASVWAVESPHRPEWVGWWVICGDLPSDVLAAHDLATPRDALRAFGKRWLLHGESLDRGDVPPAWAHEPHAGLPKLAALLKRRGAALQVWADDAAAWPAEEEAD